MFESDLKVVTSKQIKKMYKHLSSLAPSRFKSFLNALNDYDFPEESTVDNVAEPPQPIARVVSSSSEALTTLVLLKDRPEAGTDSTLFSSYTTIVAHNVAKSHAHNPNARTVVASHVMIDLTLDENRLIKIELTDESANTLFYATMMPLYSDTRRQSLKFRSQTAQTQRHGTCIGFDQYSATLNIRT